MHPDEQVQTYAAACKELKVEWYYGERSGPIAAELRDRIAVARAELRQLPPETLDLLPDRRSFWIDLYNGAVIDRAISAGVECSVREVRGFFRDRQIGVAGRRLSLDDIEHGFLRANRRHPARLFPPLLLRPGLKDWICRPFDPRIHFALNCGGRSCPPVAVYTPDAIDAQLDLAAASFLDAEVEVDAQEGIVRASRILRWYWFDFGGKKGIEDLLRRYRTGGLEERPWKFTWKEYDWSL